MARLLWKRLEESRTDGHCLICTEVIPKGMTMVTLRTGPEAEDWRRAHPQCAIASDEVMGKPQEALYRLLEHPSRGSVDPAMAAVTTVTNVSPPVIRVQSDLSLPRQSERHWVTADDARVLGFSDEREALGACRAIRMLQQDSHLRHTVLGR